MAVEPIARALIAQMLRTGALDEDDLTAMAEWLNDRDEGAAATKVMLCALEASAGTPSEQEAEMRRRRFEIVPKGDGT